MKRLFFIAALVLGCSRDKPSMRTVDAEPLTSATVISAPDARPKRYSCADFMREKSVNPSLAKALEWNHVDLEDGEAPPTAYMDCIEIGRSLVGFSLASEGIWAHVVMTYRDRDGDRSQDYPIGGVGGSDETTATVIRTRSRGWEWVWPGAFWQHHVNHVSDDTAEKGHLESYDFGFSRGVFLTWERSAYRNLFWIKDGKLAPYVPPTGFYVEKIVDADHDGRLDVILWPKSGSIEYLAHNTGASLDTEDTTARSFLRDECPAPNDASYHSDENQCVSPRIYACSLTYGLFPNLSGDCRKEYKDEPVPLMNLK